MENTPTQPSENPTVPSADENPPILLRQNSPVKIVALIVCGLFLLGSIVVAGYYVRMKSVKPVQKIATQDKYVQELPQSPPLDTKSNCKHHDVYLPLPTELQGAEITLDSQKVNPFHKQPIPSPGSTDRGFRFAKKEDYPDFDDYCSEAWDVAIGNVVGDMYGTGRGTRFEKETFKIVSLISSKCSGLACIDSGSTGAELLLEDKDGKSWLILAGDLFNSKRKNSPKAMYYSTVKTKDGMEKAFVPEDYFKESDGLFLIN